MAREDSARKGLGDFIRTQRRLADLSLRQLANAARVSNAYLSQVERGIYRPSAQVLKAIAEGLEISAETLFTRAGLLDADEPPRSHHRPAVEEAIRLDQDLNPQQKEALIRVYRSYRAAGA